MKSFKHCVITKAKQILKELQPSSPGKGSCANLQSPIHEKILYMFNQKQPFLHTFYVIVA